jgi:hypothetical protein
MVFQLWRPILINKQLAGLIIAFFAVLGLIGGLASIALPHAKEMVLQQDMRKKEAELLQIRSAVMEMLRISPSGKLESIGPVEDLTLVQTSDDQPLILADYLPPDMGVNIDSGCKYSFTSEGYVLQLTH